MVMNSVLAALAIAVSLYPQDVPEPKNPAAPDLARRWAEAISIQLLAAAYDYKGQRPESVEMIEAMAMGRMGMNQGWFHPGQSRLGWSWLAARMDKDGDGTISREEFVGPPDFFDRLDRNQDGVLTAADFDWWPMKPAKEQPPPVGAKKEMKGGGGPSMDVLSKGLFSGEIGSPYEGPRVGRRVPLFTLPTHDGKMTIALADHLGTKPVVLIFGSVT